MNDFTKEELLILKDLTFKDIHWLRENSKCIHLHPKIQFLIENYCEHESYLCGYGNGMFAECGKCGQIKRVVRK